MNIEQIKVAHLAHSTQHTSSAFGQLRAPSSFEHFSLAHAKKVNNFHKSLPNYSITPLSSLNSLAQRLGLARIWVKDESFRFGLNAFKALGGSYAIGCYLAQRLGKDIAQLPFKKLVDPKTKEDLGEITFIAATDGNHGRGVAWTAQQLNQRSIIYLPKGSAQERLQNIQALGSEAQITNLNYDDTVRLVNKLAEEHGWVVVQDTSWENYEDIPGWIMEGYTTMAFEAYNQLLSSFPGEKPTHLFLQAGVGAMAGALTGFFAQLYGKDRPTIVIVEPNNADCLYQTASAHDNQLHFVTGDLDSIMAGLCCGEPCALGWKVLEQYADFFISVPDSIAEKGMQLLGKPLSGDPRVISGESGAVTTGLVAEILENPDLRELRETLNFNENSRVLCFSTEGDTDKESYRKILAKAHS